MSNTNPFRRTCHGLTVTGTFQPHTPLQESFQWQNNGFYDSTGFIDAPAFIPTGRTYFVPADDDWQRPAYAEQLGWLRDGA